PSLGNGEDFLNASRFFADFSVGINWHHQLPSKRLRTDVGLAMFHINQPNVSFMEDNSVALNYRISTYAFGEVAVADKLDFLFRATGQFQDTYREVILSAGGRIHINQTKTQELAIGLVLGYRLQDAVIPGIEVDYKSWRVGFTYDVNTSGFMEATDFRGGPEVTVMYFFRKVQPLEAYRACPIF
ncbi:MAG: type IX secretion system membrane protein PorP/SprF, partial [Bacteroidota bacterium]